MSGSDAAIAAVRKGLDGRRLVWFGIRGEDGEALLALPELDASYSVIAALRSGSLGDDHNVSLERLGGVRPDLDRYDLDLDGANPAVQEFRRRLLREVSGRCVLMTYRPSALVSALAFSMDETLTLAGLYKDRQSAFEHKPWVERSLSRRGVRGLGWRYVADEHRARARRLVNAGPQILRASRTSGGVGIELVRTAEELDRSWPEQPDSFVAVAPYLEDAIPVNFSGCVFSDGSVRLHPPSVQLIGIASCTDRPFGYCGNDFGAVADLGSVVLDQIDALGHTTGRWLFDERYLGAFGVDALVQDGRVHFTEINPRFQGSSGLSAEIAAELEEPDLFLDHLAATLGLPPTTPGLTIEQWATRQRRRTQIVVHNVTSAIVERDLDRAAPSRTAGTYSQLPRAVQVSPGGTLCRIVVPRSATATGFEIDADAERLVADWQQCFTTTTNPIEVAR